jgi:hypothetical protein
MMVGASYTDIHVGLPALWLLIGLSIIAAWANVRVRSFRIPLADGRTFATVIVAIHAGHYTEFPCRKTGPGENRRRAKPSAKSYRRAQRQGRAGQRAKGARRGRFA